MKLKKVLAVSLVVSMMASLAACGSSDSSDTSSTDSSSTSTSASSAGDTEDVSETEEGIISYADLKLGEDLTDLSAEISVYNHRTDMQQTDYKGTTWDQYLEEFNKEYPNIKVNIETATDYAETALLRLQSGDWGDVMMIPAVDKADFPTYFM